MTLKSADPRAHPAIRPNYLAAANDMDALVTGLHFARRLAGAPPFDRYRGEEFLPGAAAQSEAALTDFIRAKSETLYHPVGTCRMGADARGVVDDRLRVRGVEALRVADASIMPTIVGGHINAAAIMIGEKAADLSGRVGHSQTKRQPLCCIAPKCVASPARETSLRTARRG